MKLRKNDFVFLHTNPSPLLALIVLVFMASVVNFVHKAFHVSDLDSSNNSSHSKVKTSTTSAKDFITPSLYSIEHQVTTFDPQDLSSIDASSASPSNHSRLKQSDLFISVKTTKYFHHSRLDLILKTWFQLAPNETYFFTDSNDLEMQRRTRNHLVNTNCSASHNRKALVCKMSVEYDYFMLRHSDKKWWCHFDDDNYVNVPRLVKILSDYDHKLDWYFGKSSIKQPLQISQNKKKIRFTFGTGGAGFCVSRALALKMLPIASQGRLISISEKIRLPDDVTIGYVIEHMLKTKLVSLPQFHSHLESLAMLPAQQLSQQISFSYSGSGDKQNTLNLKKLTPGDVTRFEALHCRLFRKFC